MKESNIRQEIIHMLKSRYGVLAFSTVDFHYRGQYVKGAGGPRPSAIYPTDALPDSIFFHKKLSGFIEFKYAAKSLPFSDWRENQREWYNTWKEQVNLWIGVGLGTDRPNSNSPLRRRMFLVPAFQFLWTEKVFAMADMKSIPVAPEATNRIAARPHEQGGIDCNAAIQWEPFELEWVDGGWKIPSGFPDLYVLASGGQK